MFGKKNDFKYESEVRQLIKEAITPLNQQIKMLEITNQQLIQHNQKLEYELTNIRNTVYTDIQRLEKRIIDFADYYMLYF